jgi:hypothetical protein
MKLTNKEVQIDKKFEKKKPIPYSLSLMKNLVIKDEHKLQKNEGKNKNKNNRVKMQRGKSTELVSSKKEMMWRINETMDKIKQHGKTKKPQNVGWNLEGFSNANGNGMFKKKKIRFSLNEVKKQAIESGKNLKERFFKQLMPQAKRKSKVDFIQKKYSSNIQATREAQPEDSSIIQSSKKSAKSINVNPKGLKLRLTANVPGSNKVFYFSFYVYSWDIFFI